MFSVDMQNIIFFTPPKFKSEKVYPKEYVIIGNIKFATKYRKQQYKKQNHSKSLKYTYKSLLIHKKYFKSNIPFIS